MQKKHYIVQKEKRKTVTINFSRKKMDGFRVTPHNQISYPGISVNSMLLVKPSLIEKLLKKKNQRKLDYYLQYIISLLSEEGADDDSALHIALNDLTRYREIVETKYQKYLDDKYINLLLKKIDLLDHEIQNRVFYSKQMKIYQTNIEEEKEKSGKSR